MSDERVMPHDLEAERAVLGAVLLNNDRLVDARTVVEAGQFYRDAHRRLFTAMVVLADQNDAIDMVTLKDQLDRVGDLEEIGGPVYIASLMEGVPHSTNVDHYAGIVAEKAALRALIQSSSRAMADAYDAQRDAKAILESAEQAILGLASRTKTGGFETLAQIAPRAMDALERAHARKDGISGVSTGFLDIDQHTRGLQPSTVVVLGARPGMGKTSLAINIATNAAMTGKSVGFFSLEMPSEELLLRMLSAAAHINGHQMQSGFLGERDWQRIAEAMDTLLRYAVHIDETPGITLFDVRSRARRLRAEHGVDLILIDYLQLMGTTGRQDNRSLAIGEITGGLKTLAKELKIPVVLLSQLNREQEKRGTRPRLSDLRDSGSIEQDADIVMFLHRGDEDEAITELILAKHRNGPTGMLKLAWIKSETRFDNYTPYDEPQQDRRLPIGDR